MILDIINMASTELVYFPTWIAGRPGYAERIREAFREYLEGHGLRLTRQRERILDFLQVKVIGKGPMDRATCIAYWGSDQDVCKEFKN